MNEETNKVADEIGGHNIRWWRDMAIRGRALVRLKDRQWNEQWERAEAAELKVRELQSATGPEPDMRWVELSGGLKTALQRSWGSREKMEEFQEKFRDSEKKVEGYKTQVRILKSNVVGARKRATEAEELLKVSVTPCDSMRIQEQNHNAYLDMRDMKERAERKLESEKKRSEEYGRLADENGKALMKSWANVKDLTFKLDLAVRGMAEFRAEAHRLEDVNDELEGRVGRWSAAAHASLGINHPEYMEEQVSLLRKGGEDTRPVAHCKGTTCRYRFLSGDKTESCCCGCYICKRANAKAS